MDFAKPKTQSRWGEKKIASQDFVPAKYKSESCEQVEPEFIVREMSRAKISSVMNLLMALNTSNCSRVNQSHKYYQVSDIMKKTL